MRLLLDENMSKAGARILASSGHEVRRIENELRGMLDEDVLELARVEDRVLVTFDKRFSDMIYLERRPAPAALILFRMQPATREAQASIVTQIIDSMSVVGQFIVVDKDGRRVRPLP